MQGRKQKQDDDVTDLDRLGLCVLAEAYPEFIPAVIIGRRVEEMLKQHNGDAHAAVKFWHDEMHDKMVAKFG